MADALGWSYDHLQEEQLDKLTELANEALHLLSDEFAWPFLKDKTASVTVDSGDEAALLPTDFGGLPADRRPFFADGRGQVLEEMSVELMQMSSSELTSVGISVKYAIVFDHPSRRYAIRLWPTVGEDTDVSVPYWVRLPDMADDDDEVPMPPGLHPTYILCAMDHCLNVEGRMAETPYTAKYQKSLMMSIGKYGRTNQSSALPLCRVVPYSQNMEPDAGCSWEQP